MHNLIILFWQPVSCLDFILAVSGAVLFMVYRTGLFCQALALHMICCLFSSSQNLIMLFGSMPSKFVASQVPSLEKGGRDIVLISPLTTCLSVIFLVV
nr:hypothetical protein CFP56_62658 [Quercus suber]